ncbi:MAG: prepilin peptidase [Clostridiales bacterium]|nr:prepilin peptidase [Clostridiales bacterium]MCF8022669.1 prepilin peptidase [Clostridiales bacterium]
MLVNLLTVAFCLPAVYFDIKKREIPDWLTWPVIAGGLIMSMFTYGILKTIAIFVCGLIVCEFLFAVMLGGGDLKLLLGITLWGGVKYGLLVFYFSLVSALPLFVFYIIKQKKWRASVPYAIAIVCGTVITVLGGGELFCL